MAGIVVGVDGSESSRHALAWAAGEAATSGSDLLILKSWHEPLMDGPGASASHEIDLVVRDAKRDLDALATAAHEVHPGVAVASTLVDDRPARALLTRAADAELVVVGSRGKGGFLGLELGSISNKVARRSPVPVVVVRGDHDRHDGHEVVIGIDGSACSRHALRWAARWAKAHDKTLVVLLAWNYLEPEGPDGPGAFQPEYEESDARDALDTIVAEVLGPMDGPTVVRETVCDLPARAVLDRAEDACLIVVGRHGIPHWAPPELGATAGQILHHATCPVAVIPDTVPGPDPVAT